MHRYYLKKLPKSFGNFHSRITRNSSKLNQYFIPNFQPLLQRWIKFIGAKIWNNIPDDLKQNSYSLFKLKYKAQLINQRELLKMK